MLSYRHGFHAGNFADVCKHVVLTSLLGALRGKDKPFFYLDVHAGAGRYDLRSAMARKHREHESGIDRLGGCADAPPAVAAYLEAVRAINPCPPSAERRRETYKTYKWYPGSPRIARHWLRPHDRMLLAEWHPAEAALLAREFRGDALATVVSGDGYPLLKARLPPPERRGVVFIDPSYELRDEVDSVLDALKEGHRRWATGIFAAWYPILARVRIRPLHDGVVASGIRRVLVAELCVYPKDNPLGMNGTGMLLINPPWRLEEELRAVLPWLWQKLAVNGAGGIRIDWLVPE